jgi:signal transduction histidine kinase
VRRVPIHTKLLAALLVPLLGLLAVTSLELFQNSQEASDLRDQRDLALAATGPGGLISALQDERNISGLTLIGQEGLIELPVSGIDEARQVTEAALEDLEEVLDRNSQARQTYSRALDRLESDLPGLRADVDADEGPYDLDNRETARDVFDRYADIIAPLLHANTRLASAIDDAGLRRGAELIDLASKQSEAIAHLIARLIQAVAEEPAGRLDPDTDVSEASEFYHGQVVPNDEKVEERAAGDYTPAFEQLMADNEATGFHPTIQQIFETGDLDLNEITSIVSVSRDESWYGFRKAVEETLNERADEVVAAAERRLNIVAALAVLAAIVAGVIAYLVSRSITRPLRSLTEQASAMANEQLPEAVQQILETPLGEDVTVPYTEPIEVNTRDEVADVAEALDTVQESALELAVEQALLRRNIADSFVNLGRRNQNLLGRQLDFITELEQNETEPDTLANLFRLDHLATRMRRNAESLLVLAGIDPPRKWAAPVQLTDAIRAALGEVEDYQRVTVRAVEPATVVGSVAADLAHLLAELIENALVFSPPDQAVEIRGRAYSPNTGPAGHPDSGTAYTLAVIDSGLGMSPEEITRANRRLAGEESFTIAPSKYLGHYVAGNLAARHGIDVKLHDSPGHGVTATVNLPAALLTDQVTTDDTAPGAPELSAGPAAGIAAAAAPAAAASSPLELTSDVLAPLGLPPASEPPAPSESPAHEPAPLTASGLTRRTPQAGPAPEPAAPDTAGPGATPSDELLQVLANYTGQLSQTPTAARPSPPSPPTPSVPSPGSPAGRPSRPMSPVTGTPALTDLPPFPLTPPRGTPPVQRNQPPSPPPGQAPWPAPTGPPQPPIPQGREPSSSGGDLPNAAPSNTGQSNTAQAGGGLARRVPGAQLPSAEPLNIRRAADPAPPDPSPHWPATSPPSDLQLWGPQASSAANTRPGPAHAAPPPLFRRPFDVSTPPVPARRPSAASLHGAPDQHGANGPSDADQPPASVFSGPQPIRRQGTRSADVRALGRQHNADDVYGFLRDFTAGVQRGLDDSGGDSGGDAGGESGPEAPGSPA